MLINGIIYFLVGILATTFGAMAGLGGGIIIKPVLDTLKHYDVATIGVLSSFTVFSMTVVSTIRQAKSGMKFDGKRTSALALGSIVGGVLGKAIFKYFVLFANKEAMVSLVQAIVLATLLITVLLIYTNIIKLPRSNIKNMPFVFVIGMILGIVASFLGIGGGVINVAVLTIFFRMSAKFAAVHSLLIILFSQSAKLLYIAIESGFAGYDLSMLVFMIPGGIAGGFIGSGLNKKLPNKKIRTIFSIALLLMIILNIYNAFTCFMML